MALVVGTDTYVTVAEADTYFAGRLYATVWTGASSADKERALRMAAKALDRENWLATIATTTQAMAWPRAGVVDREGRAISATTVPTAIRDAQCELAQAYLSEDPTQDDGTKGVRRIVADSVSMEYDGRAPSRRLPDFVLALIKPFLVYGVSEANSVPLVF